MTLHLPSLHGPAPGRRSIALALLGIPAAMLLLLAFGEMAGGEASGVQHLPEAAALVGVMALAWRFPHVAGAILLVAGTALGVLWVTLTVLEGRPGEFGANLMAGGVLFLPPVVAGWLLFTSEP